MPLIEQNSSGRPKLITMLFELATYVEGKWRFYCLIILLVLSAMMEIVSIGSVVPFLSVLSSPETVFKNELTQPLIAFLGVGEPDELILPFAIAFGFAAVLASAMRLFLLILQTRLSFAVGHQIGVSIYHRTLFQPYELQVQRNSSDVINGIYAKSAAVSSQIVLPLLTLFSSAVMVLSVMTVLLYVQPQIAVAAFLSLGAIYLAIAALTRKKLSLDSQRVAVQSNLALKCLQEGLGGIREVLLYGTQNIRRDAYLDADENLKRAQGNIVIVSQSPRFLLEGLGIVLMAVLASVMVGKSNGLSAAVPVLGSLALGAQRLLPLLQQGYQSWSTLRGGQASLRDVLVLLEQPFPSCSSKTSPLSFEREIELKNIYFRYHGTKEWCLRGINAVIPKGSRVGIVGATGSGKSTLVDIIVGLMQPTKGKIYIDSEPIEPNVLSAWQRHIAYVPQNIFLTDSTIAENIAFGEPREKIDMIKVQEAASKAQIASDIESWASNYSTLVGERGVRLSGGQRQRLGIARAIYRDADVIVLDEATSALDVETEKSVISEIEMLGSDLTFIIIAHRYSTLKSCSQVIEILDGEGVLHGTYEEFMKSILKRSN